MVSTSSFEILAAQLSAEERDALLERIKAAVQVSEEPLYPPSSAPEATSIHTPKPDDIGLMLRLVLFLRCLFSGKTREEILREDALKAIARRVELRFSGVLDRRRGLLLGMVAAELRELRDAARFFYDALDRSVEKDKPAFYAFLASIELPETHERLCTEADPSAIAASRLEHKSSVDEAALRGSAFAAFESIFAELSEKGRRSMYQNLRSVLFLKRLSGFLFDRLLGMFREGQSSELGLSASIFEARELLLDLGDILLSMSEAPSALLMEAIFMFAENGEGGKRGESAASTVGSDMAKAESCLGRIRDFNARLPLIDLLRLASGDPHYLPRELPGGEDWLVLYKTFWRERIEARLEAWKSEHRNQKLVEEIAAFVGEPGPVRFPHISPEEGAFAPGVRMEVALVFIDAFNRGPFLRDLNRPLKIVLVDGEFYRKDNRVEFTDAYDTLLRSHDLISAFDAKLSPEGEIGGAWIAATNEIGSISNKRRKLQSIARLAEDEAEQIVKREGTALKTITHIIQGFLKGEAGGRYDSLANLSYIDGKANKDFLRSLDRAKDRCERAANLLSELSGLDLSQEA